MTFSRRISCALAAAAVLYCCSCSDMNDYTSRSSHITDSEKEYETTQPKNDSEDGFDPAEPDDELLDKVNISRKKRLLQNYHSF